MKRTFSAFLCVVLALLLLPSQAVAQESVQRTQEEALQWARDQVGEILDYDHVAGAQCVDLIKAYYAFLGFTPHTGDARTYASEAAERPGLRLIQGADPEPGDILIYTHLPNGHVAIYESDTVHYEQNVKGYTGVATPNWDYREGGSYWGVLRPTWKFIPGVPGGGVVPPDFVAPDCSWSQSPRQTISTTQPDATLAAILRVSGSASINDVTYIGCRLFDASGNQLVEKQEAPTVSNDCIDMWYDVRGELGYQMTGGAMYQYQFFAGIKIGDGIVRMESERSSFTAGWTVTPEPTPSVHSHSMLYMAPSPATYTASGVREHWYCIDCRKSFLDEEGRSEATQEELVIPQLPQPVIPPAMFLDVPAGAYYSDAITWAVSKAVAKGTDRDHFSPDAPCTRAEAVTFLWRAMGSPILGGDMPFHDVEPGTFYYYAVLWAQSQGIVNGTDTGRFSPDALCTRAEAVTFLHRAHNLPYSGESRFSDVDRTAWYAPAVAWAASRGITHGTDANAFHPNEVCTRGQVITFLYRAFA